MADEMDNVTETEAEETEVEVPETEDELDTDEVDSESEDTEPRKSAAELVQELRDKYTEIQDANQRLQDQMKDGVVNPIELGRWIGVNPPRIYQDIRDGRLTAVTRNSTQHKVIELREAIAYADRVLGRRVELAEKKAKTDKATEDRITREVMKRLAEAKAAEEAAKATNGQQSA